MIRNAYCLMFLHLLLACIDQSGKVFGQEAPAANPPLVKIGFYTFPDRITKTYRSFLFNLEMERSFRKAPAFTHGPRVDYDFEKGGADNLSLGYQLKTYPFYFLKQKAYNGFYLAGEVCYKPKLKSYTIAGPGLAASAGYQRTIKDRFLVGGEIRMSYIQNLNHDYPERNPEHRYIFGGMYLKLGIKLNGRK